MWKWIVGVLVLAVLACAGIMSGGGWYAWQQWRAEQEAKARAEEAAAQAAREVATQEAARAARLDQVTAGRAAVAAGDDRAVIEAFGDVLTGDPKNTEALLARGRAYAHTEQLALAESDLRELVRLDGGSKDGWESLAWVLARQGNDTEARDALDRVLALSPDDAKALRDRANARFRTGDTSGARSDAEQACKLGLQDGCTLAERLATMR